MVVNNVRSILQGGFQYVQFVLIAGANLFGGSINICLSSQTQ